MKLSNRLNLILSLIFTIVLSFFAVISYTMEHKQAKEEVLQTAKLVLEMSLAIRQYTIDEVVPLLKNQSQTNFLPQKVPSYVAINTFKRLKNRLENFDYKENALNPKNPLNRASEWEVEIINTFRENNDLVLLNGYRNTQSANLMYLATPVKVSDQACLKCHSTSSVAPEEIVKQYGENGFGWKMNEVQGARIITVPTSLAHQKAQKSVLTLLISIICMFALIMVTINLILKKSVIQPILQLSNIAEQISFGKKNIDYFPHNKTYELNKLIASIQRLKISRNKTLNLLKHYSGEADQMHLQMNEILSEPESSSIEG